MYQRRAAAARAVGQGQLVGLGGAECEAWDQRVPLGLGAARTGSGKGLRERLAAPQVAARQRHLPVGGVVVQPDHADLLRRGVEAGARVGHGEADRARGRPRRQRQRRVVAVGRRVARGDEHRQPPGYRRVDGLVHRRRAVHVSVVAAVTHAEDVAPHRQRPVEGLDLVRARRAGGDVVADLVEIERRPRRRPRVRAARLRPPSQHRAGHVRAVGGDLVGHEGAPSPGVGPRGHVVGFHRRGEIRVGHVQPAVGDGDLDPRAGAGGGAVAVMDIVGVDHGLAQIVEGAMQDFGGFQADEAGIGLHRGERRIGDPGQVESARMAGRNRRHVIGPGNDDTAGGQLGDLRVGERAGNVEGTVLGVKDAAADAQGGQARGQGCLGQPYQGRFFPPVGEDLPAHLARFRGPRSAEQQDPHHPHQHPPRPASAPSVCQPALTLPWPYFFPSFPPSAAVYAIGPEKIQRNFVTILSAADHGCKRPSWEGPGAPAPTSPAGTLTLGGLWA